VGGLSAVNIAIGGVGERKRDASNSLSSILADWQKRLIQDSWHPVAPEVEALHLGLKPYGGHTVGITIATRSLYLDEVVIPAVHGAARLVSKAVERRLDAIKEAGGAFLKDLRDDRIDDVDAILTAKPNSAVVIVDREGRMIRRFGDQPGGAMQIVADRYAQVDLLSDIVEAALLFRDVREQLRAELRRFHRFDGPLASPTVQNRLEGIGLLLHYFKALIAQESGDFRIVDYQGAIQGWAQMDSNAVNELGAEPGQRHQPSHAFDLAAKWLEKKYAGLAYELEQRGIPRELLTQAPDRPRLVAATYNVGEGAMATAIALYVERVKRSVPLPTWEELVKVALLDGLRQTPLYAGKAQEKFVEVTTFIERIDRRVSGE